MHLKASKCPTVVILYVSFSYPVISVRRSIGFKLNQMSPVVMLVHAARLSKCKVGLLLRFGLVGSICWTAVSLLSGRLTLFYRILGLVGLRYQLPRAGFAVL